MSGFDWLGDEALVRVVAIGIEGLMRSRPRMTVEHLLLLDRDDPDDDGEAVPPIMVGLGHDRVVEAWPQMPCAKTYFGDNDNPRRLSAYRLPLADSWIRTSLDYKAFKVVYHRLSQKEVERLVAGVFTRGQTVERVSDTAIAHARKMILDAQS